MGIRKCKFHNTFFSMRWVITTFSLIISCICWGISERCFVSDEAILVPLERFFARDRFFLWSYECYILQLLAAFGLHDQIFQPDKGPLYFFFSSFPLYFFFPVFWRFSKTDVFIFSHVSSLGFWISHKITQILLE